MNISYIHGTEAKKSSRLNIVDDIDQLGQRGAFVVSASKDYDVVSICSLQSEGDY